MENIVIKVVEEHIKEGSYFTYDNEVISQNIYIEEYFDDFGLRIEIKTNEDALANLIRIVCNHTLIHEFTIDKDKLDINLLQMKYHAGKLEVVKEALMEKYKMINTKVMKVGFDKDTGLPYTYYTEGPKE